MRYLLSYLAVGACVYIWMLTTVKEEHLDGGDIWIARLLMLPWCLILWPVELYNDIKGFIKNLQNITTLDS
jgi:hypothetical protein